MKLIDSILRCFQTRMKVSFCLSISVFCSLSAQAQLVAPSGAAATWINDGSRKVTITWQNNSSGSNTGWEVQRRSGHGTVWANHTAASSLAAAATSYTDTTIANDSVLRYYHYRVRAVNSSSNSGWAEVSTAGIPSQWPATNYDTDADGITDSVETSLSLNPNNWADGSGDLDGDYIPNAWDQGGGLSIGTANALNTSSVHVTVDASYTGADTDTLTKTITAAIGKLTGANATNPPFRLILVKPGIYKENIAHSAHLQIALVADRSGGYPKKECEIQGVTNDPVISTNGSLVLDGFVITRAPGTAGAAFSVTQTESPGARIYLTRMTNCIVRNMNTGVESAVRQNRGMLTISHSTFLMNSLENASPAHAYSTGPLTGANPMESTSRVQIWNSIFWNPVNTSRPEFQSVGDWSVTSSISYGASPAGASDINPGLTPKGYPIDRAAACVSGGSLGAQVLRDMFGEIRYDPPGRGAVEWEDTDCDSIPDFADSNPSSSVNAMNDLDFDRLSELGEYLGGTSLESADSNSLTLDQALNIFAEKGTILQNVLTRAEGDALYMPLNPTPLKKVRIAPGGDIDMGIFQ